MDLQNEQGEKFKRISSLFHVIVCACNDVANSVMLDAIAEIQKTKYYRHGIKKACNDAKKRYSIFERKNFEDMKGDNVDKRQVYMDFLDSVNDRLRKHLFKFYMSIKSVLDKHDIPESALKARIICAGQLLTYSIVLFDKFFDKCPEIPPIDLRATFASARLQPTKNAWDVICDKLCKDCQDINFEDDINCKTAFNIIELQIIDEKLINKSGMEALNLNPEWK